MTMKIGQPPSGAPNPKPNRPAPAARGCDFAAELRRHQIGEWESKPRHAAAEVAEFLAAGPDAQDHASIFNAEGFFARLQAVLDQRGAEPSLSSPHLLRQDEPGEAAPSSEIELELPDAALPAPAHHFVARSAPDISRTNPSLHLRAASSRFAAAPLPASTASLPLDPHILANAERLERAAPQAARRPIRAWLEGGSVHVAAPLHSLGRDEEAELLERIADLLASQGLPLAAITINGRSFSPPNQRK